MKPRDLSARRLTNLSLITLLGIAAILSVLAALQYRWISEVSDAEQVRLKQDLSTATRRFAEDFSQELRPFRRTGAPGGTRNS